MKSIGKYIPFLLVASWFIYSVWPKPDSTSLRSPYQKNGTDTVYTEDSVYVIKFKVVEAYERRKEQYDPGDLRP